MNERIQKILSARGVASRRKAELMILEGRVTCNGEVCGIGDTANPAVDTILVDGKPLPEQRAYVYLMLNKPRGYVTTLFDEKGRKNAAQLVENCGRRVYPVGRLDMDSEGLLLFTNDGNFANRMMHPKHEVNKTYLVDVNHYSENGLQRLQEPMELDGYRLRRPEVTLVKHTADRAVLKITIHEGRNRQVRRMCAIAGMSVHRLKRIAEGGLSLGDLPAGKWRSLTSREVETLLEG